MIDSVEPIADPAWVREMRALWWQVEVVDALVLDEERSTLTDEEQSAVADAVDALTAMVTPC